MRESLINNLLSISSIPRLSGNEKQLSDYIVSIAKRNNLEYYQDENNNILIKKKGNIEGETIAFQAHLDMVGVKTNNSNHNFDTDPIEVLIDGDKVTAKDTSLGADQGVGLSIMLTLLLDDSIKHPSMEFLFTTEEETTFNGIVNYPFDKMSSKQVINLDGANDDTVIVGSTGDIVNDYKYKCELIKSDLPSYKVKLSGLNGGNSGENIELSINNAIITLVKLIKDKNVMICSINGGSFENDIATNCEMVLKTNDNIYEMFNGFDIEKVNEEYAFSIEDSKNIINELLELRSGYITGSTSCNLGMIRTTNNEVTITYLIRSTLYEELDSFNDKFNNLNYGFICEEKYRDSIWSPDSNSRLLDKYRKKYYDKYHEYPKETICPCGLECNVMKNRISDLDIICIGANIKDYHTTNEVTYISSWVKIYDILIDLLKG